jgi:single-strand DNA-binding protein
MSMNSFTVTAVGNIAKNPELTVKGDTSYTRFCLVGNDYGGKDEQGNVREVVTSLWFVAFENLGEAIAKNARKGDQLILQAQIRSNNWTDKEGEKQYDYSFVVQSFRFGAPGKAKREELARREERSIGALETEL